MEVDMGYALLKEAENSRAFDRMPAVLIQHPTKGCAYYLSEADISLFSTTAESLAGLRAGTVTFTISDELVDEVPPFNLDPANEPDVLIRFAKDRTSYLVSAAELERFRVDQPRSSFGDHYVSFIIPSGLELVEEIPLLKKGLLQSNTG
jgi:hypothetical protein